MKAHWLALAARYDALQLRERRLVAAAVLGGILLLGYALFIDPALQRAKIAERSVTEQRAQIAGLQAQLQSLQSPNNDPDVAARAELVKVKQQLNEMAARLATLEGSLVPPQNMPRVLEDMVGRRSGLRLLSLKTLPAAPLIEKKSGATDSVLAKVSKSDAETSAPGLFKHGVEIKLEGSYGELAAYLDRLERAKLKILWSNLSLSGDKYPKLVLTLTVYTLSLDRAWLIV